MAKRIPRSAAKPSGKANTRRAKPAAAKREAARDPASTLLLADAAILAGSYIVRRAVKKGLLQGRYGDDATQDLQAHKNIGQSVVAIGLAKLATRSLPGAVLIGGSAVAKALYDRRQARRKKQGKRVKGTASPQLPDEQP